MNTVTGWCGRLLAIAVAMWAPRPVHHADLRTRGPEPSVCAADTNYQRLAFWIGDWEVVDSAGAHYATQHVDAVLDSCAIVAEWKGIHGDRGLNLSAFDRRTGEWRQMYASNQVPAPAGVSLRRSDSLYGGPGIRFIPLVEPTGNALRSRVTIMPIGNDRAMQLFEDSRDGGKTWRVIFRAEHRRQANGKSE